MWSRVLASDVNNFVLPTLEEHDDLTNSCQDVEGIVCGGAHDAVDDTAKPMSIAEKNEDWKLVGAIGLSEAEQLEVKKRLQKLQESCLAKKERFLRRSPRYLEWQRSCYCMEALQIIRIKMTRRVHANAGCRKRCERRRKTPVQ